MNHESCARKTIYKDTYQNAYTAVQNGLAHGNYKRETEVFAT
jgi:hypothetical protein